MDQRRQLLFVSQCCGTHVMALQYGYYAAIQVSRGEFYRVTGHYPRVKAIEPTGSPIIPGTVLDHRVMADTKASRLGKGAIGELIHADRTRGRPIHLKGLSRPRPAPVRARDWISGTLHLRYRGEQLRGHDAG